jgi:hypothetical protein
MCKYYYCKEVLKTNESNNFKKLMTEFNEKVSELFLRLKPMAKDSAQASLEFSINSRSTGHKIYQRLIEIT